MQHEIFSGAHYEIGVNFGQRLREDGRLILSQLPLTLTSERREFAAACLPVYQKFFPEIIAEISGLAHGQSCATEDIQALLFSMYALPPACQCSCLALAYPEQILLGRNSDFLPALEELNMNVIYRFADNVSSANFTGNTTAFIEMEDGVNQYGLALGLTAVAPAEIQPGFNAGLLLRYLLEKCRTTQQVLQACRNLPMASAQTLIAADAQGDIALLEICAQRTEIILPQPERPFVWAVNQFSAASLADCQNIQVDNWQADERWQTLERGLNRGRLSLIQIQELLAGQNGFLCQYDRTTGKDTVWSVVYDLTGGGVYRAEGNPQRQTFIKDERFTW